MLMAVYMNPDAKMITIINNYLRGTTARAYYELSQIYKDKIVELNLTNSMI